VTRLGRAALLIDVGIVLGFVLARALEDARGHRHGGPPGICNYQALKENVR
jgi:hypothetical protein